MEGRYFLLALVVTCSQDTQAHILPFTHSELPVQNCVRELTRSMINLCSIYSDYSSELFFDNGLPLIPREVTNKSWDMREKMIMACCSRPCVASELFAMC